jgi:hypothetical protein
MEYISSDKHGDYVSRGYCIQTTHMHMGYLLSCGNDGCHVLQGNVV